MADISLNKISLLFFEKVFLSLKGISFRRIFKKIYFLLPILKSKKYFFSLEIFKKKKFNKRVSFSIFFLLIKNSCLIP